MNSKYYSTIADCAVKLFDVDAIEAVCNALDSNNFSPVCSPARRKDIASGNPMIEALLLEMHQAWRKLPEVSASELSRSLRIASQVMRIQSSNVARTELVWTGPKDSSSHLRATRQVVLDIIDNTHNNLLLVGYWIAVSKDADGIVNKIIDRLVNAAHKGVRVRIILDKTIQPGGNSNRDFLLSCWPSHIDAPQLFTWHLPNSSEHTKLHAKVMVSDYHDALVTSANLTTHAMEFNMEMGIRVTGYPASSIANHFDRLISCGVLVPF